MEKALALTAIVCVLFGVLKYLEMRFIEKRNKPLKEIVRDLVMVFGATFSTAIVFMYYQDQIDDFLSVITNTNMLKAETTQVFTGVPDF